MATCALQMETSVPAFERLAPTDPVSIERLDPNAGRLAACTVHKNAEHSARGNLNASKYLWLLLYLSLPPSCLPSVRPSVYTAANTKADASHALSSLPG